MSKPAPNFETRDPTAPEFWSDRFRQQFMPWDRGGVPQALIDFAGKAGRSYVTLIPGCGMGYEVAFLSEAGWEVTAIDFSPAAVDAARSRLGPWADRVREADFFSFQPAAPLELIYEQAFLCALPPARWADIAQRWAQLLPPGGLLAGLFFLGATPKGPPFGIDSEELERLLGQHFVQVCDEPAMDSIPVFAGREHWQVWRRR